MAFLIDFCVYIYLTTKKTSNDVEVVLDAKENLAKTTDFPRTKDRKLVTPPLFTSAQFEFELQTSTYQSSKELEERNRKDFRYKGF